MRVSVILGACILAAGLGALSCSDDEEAVAPTSVKEVENFTAVLSPANETTPVPTTASGTATLSIVGGVLTYRVDVADIISPTLGHIHGPALQGANAGVKVNFCGTGAPAPPCATGTPYTGVLASGVATQVTGISWDSLVVLLRNGNAYVNVHSTAYPGGEMRGQVVPKP